VQNSFQKLFKGTFYFSSDEEPARSPSAPAMSESGNTLNERGKVIHDPVHTLIPIRSDEVYLLDLIDTPEFQIKRTMRELWRRASFVTKSSQTAAACQQIFIMKS